MNRLSRILIVIVASGFAAAGGIAHAGEMDCSGTKRSLSSPYSEVIQLGDDPSHKMMQQIRVHLISSNDPDFDGAEQTVYAHQDEYAGAGTSVGYYRYTLKSGEKIWAKYDSTYSVAGLGTADWKATYQGVFHFVSGTGKYAGIRGGGHYQGTVTPSVGFNETSVCSAVY